MPRARIAVDFHLHFYPQFAEARFWDSWIANIDHAAAVPERTAAPWERVALLTESAWCNAFSIWAGRNAIAASGYSFRATGEPHSLALDFRGERRALIVSGRQIVTAERLEVLTAASRLRLPDGRPFTEIVKALHAAGDLVIIPWGAGKWLGRRGRLVEKVVHAPDLPGIFLADNPARPAWWPVPPAFQAMARRGVPVLRGSDPLPLAGEERHAGSFASMLSGEFDPHFPLASLRAILAQGGPSAGIGRRDGGFTFLQRQLRLRLKKSSLSLAAGVHFRDRFWYNICK